MKTTLKGAALALALSSAAMSAQAVNVTLTGWGFGSGNSVNVAGTGTPAYSGQAGAFTGSLSGAGSHDIHSFLTYCIELEENFSFSTTAMTGYSLVAGASYFQARRGDAGKSELLNRLMTYASDVTGRVDNPTESSALQLAIWNIVYDADFSVATTAGFHALSSSSAGISRNTYANTLLAGALTISTSRFDVFALEKVGKQDFLLLSTKTLPPSGLTAISEPASLALIAVALGVAGAAMRRRRRKRPSV